ncbi:N-carbamoylputrescine amidase [Tamaricihabitans halophyticus]|uniref:N-carbamoylputrescine amidase n=1 Tax=Tamaricihabitans halophyticus TaxID=1262583 RepID=A0A4R2QG83_9PSEU|nr:carbon-nitrogen hydrolase family protein [Tamaricihabitans halophyticus]TCP47338.1 N-carbamoylputrescine amidase [Tamaricihabitans halophyticus]
MTTLRLGMIQMNSKVTDRDRNVATACKYIDEAAGNDAELIVLPEFFNTEYFAQYWDYAYIDYAEPEDGYTLSMVRDKAIEHSRYICATIYERQAPGLYFDTAFLIDPLGAIVGRYRKTHPAAMRSVEKIYYRGGTRFPVWQVNGFRVGAIICYDHMFPEAARSAAVNGVEVLLGPFAAPQLPTWDQVMITRAFENGVYLAPCNKVGTEDTWTFGGGSMVVDPYGTILHKASTTDDEVFVVELDQRQLVQARIQHPFLRDRSPAIYSALVSTDEQTRALPS